MTKKDYSEKAFWIYCRSCGIEYLEAKSWILNYGKTECPRCKNKLTVD